MQENNIKKSRPVATEAASLRVASVGLSYRPHPEKNKGQAIKQKL